ncbi:hypothetical protein [Paenibacillus psychroresistens]|nr:hypothetical protein [Paenibacillus psychroresistens]
MKLKPWKQELMWVQRNDRDVIINTSEKPPQTGDIIPTVPNLVKK